MQFATRPNRFDMPGECIALPGRVYDENGGVLLDGVYDGVRGDMRLWLSYAGIRTIMRRVPQLDLAEGADLRAAVERAETAEREREHWLEEAQRLQAKLERINGLRKDGYKISRVPGRPAKAGATS